MRLFSWYQHGLSLWQLMLSWGYPTRRSTGRSTPERLSRHWV